MDFLKTPSYFDIFTIEEICDIIRGVKFNGIHTRPLYENEDGYCPGLTIKGG